MSGSATNTLGLTAQIVSAHIGHTVVRTDALSGLIQAVYRALSTIESGPLAAPAERPQPAVPVKKSIFPDYIICLEDGHKLKMLKRHLQTAYNMTPAQYRERWGLGADYPMVAPSYAARRSVLAKQIGLGRKPGPLTPAATEDTAADTARDEGAPARKKPGRPKRISGQG